MNPTINRIVVVAFGLVVLASAGCQTKAGDTAQAPAAAAPASTSTANVSTPPPGVVAAEQAKYDAMQKAIQEKYAHKK